MTELQTRVLNLLKEIDELCKENDISYYLIGGTLIGAVRHHGFIPWDDDADIIMTRDNWEKFYSSFKASSYIKNRKINALDDNVNTPLHVNRYCETTSANISRFHLVNPEEIGILVDVLVMDPIPEDDNVKNAYIKTIATQNELINLHYPYSFRNGLDTCFKYYWKKIAKEGKEKIIRSLDWHYEFEDGQSACFYAQRFAGAIHFWPIDAFGEPKYVEFEDTKLPIPQHPHRVLQIGYDDEWMMIPHGAKETHEHTVRNYEVSSTNIICDFKKHVDMDEITSKFIKRKLLWQKVFPYRMLVEDYCLCLQSKAITSVYRKKNKEIDVLSLVDNENYDELENFFKEYDETQSQKRFVGSSALAGWQNTYRKYHRVLIDIGDTNLFAYCMLLLHQNRIAQLAKVLDARKRTDIPFSDEIVQIEKIYNYIFDITNYLVDKDVLGGMQLVLKAENVFPRIKWFKEIKLLLEVKQKNDDEYNKAVEECYKKNTKDEIIQFVHIINSTRLKKISSCIDEIASFINITRNGLLLYEIKCFLEDNKHDLSEDSYCCLIEKLNEQMGIETCKEEKNHDIDEKNNTFYHQTDLVQSVLGSSEVLKVRFELLVKLNDICTKNNINYYLGEKALLQAVRYGKFVDCNTDIAVYMTPQNAEDFVCAIQSQNDKKYFVDSMKESDNFPRICIRFGKGASLDCVIDSTERSCKCGIYITIEILKYESKKKLKRRLNHMLEIGWECKEKLSYTVGVNKFFAIIVKMLCVFFGTKKIGNAIYLKLVRIIPEKSTGEYTYKNSKGKRIFLKPYWFIGKDTVFLENIELNTLYLYENYLKKLYGDNWQIKDFPKESVNNHRVISTELPYEEYICMLKNDSNLIALDKAISNEKRINNKLAKINKFVNKYWDLMEASGERIRLYLLYQSKKDELINLSNTHKYSELSEMLDEYYNSAKEFLKKNIAITFDKQITELLLLVMYFREDVRSAKKFDKLVKIQKWDSPEIV